MKVKGLSIALGNLDKYGKKVVKKVHNEMEASANNIRNGALRRAPVGKQVGKGTGQLRASIAIAQGIDRSSFSVVANAFYAPYVEFGTGSFASQYLSSKDADLQQYARQFYVNGKGRMPPQPFMFPAFEEERVKLVKRLKKVLKDGS